MVPDPAKSGLHHASAVAVGPRGVLIMGRSGSGKSALALNLMAMGATLVSDDQVLLSLSPDGLVARPPDTIRGRIEARGVGLLNAETCDSARIVLVVQMDRNETERLPIPRSKTILNQQIPLLHMSESDHFAAAILQYLKVEQTD